jgi:hypothetical protein
VIVPGMSSAEQAASAPALRRARWSVSGRCWDRKYFSCRVVKQNLGSRGRSNEKRQPVKLVYMVRVR